METGSRYSYIDKVKIKYDRHVTYIKCKKYVSNNLHVLTSISCTILGNKDLYEQWSGCDSPGFGLNKY